MTNKECRYIMTPDGKGWMFGYDEVSTVTVNIGGEGKSIGHNACFDVDECEEVEE